MILRYIAGFFICAVAASLPTAKLRIRRGSPLDRFTLPDNATSIRENIDTSFSCLSRSYGYYADVDNDCQLFHVCLPVLFDSDDSSTTLMWSFICPQETMFNQERFTCARPEDSIPCKESTMFYSLNDRFGERTAHDETTEANDSVMSNETR